RHLLVGPRAENLVVLRPPCLHQRNALQLAAGFNGMHRSAKSARQGAIGPGAQQGILGRRPRPANQGWRLLLCGAHLTRLTNRAKSRKPFSSEGIAGLKVDSSWSDG